MEAQPSTFESIKELITFSPTPVEHTQQILKEKQEPSHIAFLKPQANSKLEGAQVLTSNKLIYERDVIKPTFQTTSMMHLSLAKSVETIAREPTPMLMQLAS